MHRLDVEYFGTKYRKSKSSGRKMGKYKAKEIKDISYFVKIGKRLMIGSNP